MFSCLKVAVIPHIVIVLTLVVPIVLLPLPGLSLAEVRSLTGDRRMPSLAGQTTVYVEADSTTWKTRGRLMYDIEGAVRSALASAGFEVVRMKNEPHALTVSIDYDELKGEPYGINQFGTDIAGVFTVSHHEQGALFQILVEETTHPTVSGTPPYLDTLYNFQTNPYYYLLGEIVWARTQHAQNAHAVFIEALKRTLSESQQRNDRNREDSQFSPSDFAQPFSKRLFAPYVIRRIIDEFVNAQDRSIIPLLEDLLNFPDVYVRVRSIGALKEFQVATALPLLHRLQKDAPEIEVRQAAQTAIQGMATPQR